MAKPLATEFAQKGFSYIDTPYSKLDCQALVEAMLQDVGIRKNWDGSNAMYRDMAWVGTPEECKKKFGCVPVGAWIFILLNDGGEPAKYRKDGIGNADHVGVKVGSGKGVIHSSYTNKEVCESTFKDKTIPNGGWNRVGLSRLLDYGENIERELYGVPIREEPSSSSFMEETKLEEEVVIHMTTATVTTSGGILNVRQSPSSDGRKIGELQNGTTVSVLEKTTETWWKIQQNDLIGYCSKSYLDEIKTVSITLDMNTAGALYRALDEVLVD